MSIIGIREALHRKPFRSFSFGLVDGRTLAVRHPEFVILGRRLVTVIEDENNWSVVDPLLILSIEYSDSTQRPPRPS